MDEPPPKEDLPGKASCALRRAWRVDAEPGVGDQYGDVDAGVMAELWYPLVTVVPQLAGGLLMGSFALMELLRRGDTAKKMRPSAVDRGTSALIVVAYALAVLAIATLLGAVGRLGGVPPKRIARLEFCHLRQLFLPG